MSTSTPPASSPGADAQSLEVLLELVYHSRAAYRTDISNGVGLAVNASRTVIQSTARKLYGWSLRETTGAAKADVRLHDGKDQTTELLATIDVPSGGSNIVPPTTPGIRVLTGTIFLEVVGGSVEGVLYWLPITEWDE